MGSSSFSAMDRVRDCASHCSWNQDLRCHAPQPQEPDASDVNSTKGSSAGVGRKETPFQSIRNDLHHARSERKTAVVYWPLDLSIELLTTGS